MKVCILSDSHDHRILLEAAVVRAKAAGAETVLHCGDVVAPSTLRCLERYGLPVHVIHGNNVGDLYTLGRLSADADSVVRYHGMDAGLKLGGRRIFLVHYPHYARAMAATGDWDLVCCGHSHEPAIERLPNILGDQTLVLNPGTVGGVGGVPATLMIGDLTSLEFEILELEKGIERQALSLAAT